MTKTCIIAVYQENSIRSMLDQITPVILCFNEEANIRRTLDALDWAKEVVIVDSGSSDNTLKICAEFNNVRVVHNPFENAAKQNNFALAQDINTPWVLSMDADYVLTEQLIAELKELQPDSDINGYQTLFQYLLKGKPLRGSLYPPRTTLYRHKFANYIQDGHTQRVRVEGAVGSLNGRIQHDDRKSLKRWLRSQSNYAKLESKKLKSAKWSSLSTPDKLRKTGIAPILIVPYTLIFKGLILDGWAGLVYSSQRFLAELYLQVARFAR